MEIVQSDPKEKVLDFRELKIHCLQKISLSGQYVFEMDEDVWGL